MAKPKGPGLADYAVHLYGYQPLKIRATSLLTSGGWLYLRDAAGGILFAAPQSGIHYVKHLEPGEAMAAPERLPEPESAPEAEAAPVDIGLGALIESFTVDPEPSAEVTEDGPKVDRLGRKHGERGRFTR